ncbi:MAG TPA: tRNA (adenosine(37)-N6)-threonylcarbamoyltransferase complex dimerization subunit type 1 TsaB [Intrasporangium sp.]|uniref:tRNA (adenosine(37)-N6)-threonylcarbamoyltransferase complex dimerization subunit type 1 TsaB n=1 Tax=Intrasporangium sp. TaxID=1925024 RepID=UPI002D773818|nr:tRNA (adenosine(37)-N6)-threonylcarbamoyltransferase complex dimerization subunit type 1 TsaB [Intrasporangium sp.]HET7398924.1 tRNA (adenosine(37)-N6)-threonylcarbamoyltransferase complex dimerization subunit type 1 TsaB [Intrasporangium sp.]
MLLLAIDTSTTAITAALCDGDSVLAEATTLDARAHAEHLAPGIRTVLADVGARPADVTDVAVGTGPGPFTGLRVGIATARTFAFALGVPVHGVCSLDALAHAAWLAEPERAGELLVATDARRKEVYAAVYRLSASGAERVDGPCVSRAADLPEPVRSLPAVGRGPLLYPGALPHGAPPLDVSAGTLADLAVRRLRAGERLPGVDPLYLRRPDAAPTGSTGPSRKSTLG